MHRPVFGEVDNKDSFVESLPNWFVFVPGISLEFLRAPFAWEGSLANPNQP